MVVFIKISIDYEVGLFFTFFSVFPFTVSVITLLTELKCVFGM